mmetsp:Transcript_79205/g.183792  ORF Transcript_79205/g.183792 Transcript_79205/m.183792 type:complete len:208 (+) Transcript_79205:230-853(+)
MELFLELFLVCRRVAVLEASVVLEPLVDARLAFTETGRALLCQQLHELVHSRACITLLHVRLQFLRRDLLGHRLASTCVLTGVEFRLAHRFRDLLFNHGSALLLGFGQVRADACSLDGLLEGLVLHSFCPVLGCLGVVGDALREGLLACLNVVQSLVLQRTNIAPSPFLLGLGHLNWAGCGCCRDCHAGKLHSGEAQGTPATARHAS